MAIRYSAAALRERVTVSKPSGVYGKSGAPDGVWANHKTSVPAGKFELSGREFYAAQQINAETPAVFVLRYDATITPAMRIVHGGRTWRIEAIMYDVPRRWMEIRAREIA